MSFDYRPHIFAWHFWLLCSLVPVDTINYTKTKFYRRRGPSLPSRIGLVSAHSGNVQTLAGHEWWWPTSRQRAVLLPPAGCCQPLQAAPSEHLGHHHTLRREKANVVRHWGWHFYRGPKTRASSALTLRLFPDLTLALPVCFVFWCPVWSTWRREVHWNEAWQSKLSLHVYVYIHTLFR